MIFFVFSAIFLRKHLQIKKKAVTLHTLSDTKSRHNGALVQLVRIHACHAWGHGFESRTHRKTSSKEIWNSFLFQ